MAEQSATVSVIIPIKNGAAFLPSAIDSVLAQAYPELELVVVDGGSEDGSREIAQGYPDVRLINQQGSGLSDAWNTGIQQSQGELIAFLDSDDTWEPETLGARVTQMLARAGSEMQISRMRFFLEEGNLVPAGFKPDLLQGDRVAPIPGTLLARRSLFDRIGLFRSDLKIAGDVDWFARAKDAAANTDVFDSLVLHKRIHGSNLAADAKHNNKELLGLLRQSLHRQSGRS